MTTKILEPVGLTVDELIFALQSVANQGHGKLPAHALMGDHTGPVRGVDVVPGWGEVATPVALVLADDDSEEAGTVQRVLGHSLTDDSR